MLLAKNFSPGTRLLFWRSALSHDCLLQRLGVTFDNKLQFTCHYVDVLSRFQNAQLYPSFLLSIHEYPFLLYKSFTLACVVWQRFTWFLTFKKSVSYSTYSECLAFLNLASLSDVCALVKLCNSLMDSSEASEIHYRYPSHFVRNLNIFDVPFAETSCYFTSPLLRVVRDYSHLHLGRLTSSLSAHKNRIIDICFLFSFFLYMHLRYEWLEYSPLFINQNK